MNIEKLINELGKSIAKTALHKEDSRKDININEIGSGDILQIIIKRLVDSGEYNKAENILFQELSDNNSEAIYQIAINFYNSLLEKSNEELEKADFTRDEVYQGLDDIEKMRAL